jgi:lipopolysaccharide transport system ATP-binding protein
MSDIAIKIDHLSKMYRLGVINNGTLFRDIQTWIALKRGKEDPHSKIGENKYNNDDDHFWALKDLSMEIKQGDRVGIIGKNGAGKSTLLKLLSRITAPTEGTIKIKGKIASLLEVGTGFHTELTGRENIYLNGAILGMKKRRITEKLDEIIAFSGIEYHIDTPVKRYSSGMYVRLAFAVAAHLDSDILIADEVLAVGDAEFQKKALGKMQDLSTGQGRTVLFVSHNMGAVRNLCNCGVVLIKGELKEASLNINTLISNYLNNFEKSKDIYKWVNKGDFSDPYFTPISLELLEENGQPISGEISASKNYRVQLVFEVKEQNPQVGFWLVFSDISGHILFYNGPYLLNKNYKPKLGINTLFCTIPKDILNIHNYILALAVAIHAVKYIINPDNYDVSIAVNVTKIEKWDIQPNPTTVMAPRIQWYTEY